MKGQPRGLPNLPQRSPIFPRQTAPRIGELKSSLSRLLLVAENYPQLKANENFKHLQEELSGTESKIAYSRQFYNDSVMQYNEGLQVFPKNLFARLFGFTAKEFFETKGKERENVKVSF